MLAVAQHRDPVRDLEHFLQSMGDEEQRHPPVTQLARHPEELRHLVLGQRRGGLVHDEDFHVERDRFRDLHFLLCGEGEPPRRRPHVEPGAEALKDVLGRRVHAPPVGQQSLFAVGDEDVLGHVQIGEQQWLLVHCGQPARLRLLGVGQAHCRTLQDDFARIALYDAGQDLDEGRLAGAVLPDEGVDLARMERQGHVLERLRHVEALGEIAHLQHRRDPGVGSRRAAGCRRHGTGLTTTSIAPVSAGAYSTRAS